MSILDNAELEHVCKQDDFVWEKWGDTIYPLWESGGMGETMERNAKCEVCGRTIRAVYVFSCYLDNETEDWYHFEEEDEELTVNVGEI